MWHFDGTARPQTVEAPRDSGGGGDPFVHALLSAVARSPATRRRNGGLGVLINTSFNTKGRPIVNSAAEALRMLCALPDLDAVVIDAWLFEKARVRCDRLVHDE